MRKEDEEKLSINGNPAGRLEIEEFKNRMALTRKGQLGEEDLKKTEKS